MSSQTELFQLPAVTASLPSIFLLLDQIHEHTVHSVRCSPPIEQLSEIPPFSSYPPLLEFLEILSEYTSASTDFNFSEPQLICNNNTPFFQSQRFKTNQCSIVSQLSQPLRTIYNLCNQHQLSFFTFNDINTNSTTNEQNQSSDQSKIDNNGHWTIEPAPFFTTTNALSTIHLTISETIESTTTNDQSTSQSSQLQSSIIKLCNLLNRYKNDGILLRKQILHKIHTESFLNQSDPNKPLLDGSQMSQQRFDEQSLLYHQLQQSFNGFTELDDRTNIINGFSILDIISFIYQNYYFTHIVHYLIYQQQQQQQHSQRHDEYRNYSHNFSIPGLNGITIQNPHHQYQITSHLPTLLTLHSLHQSTTDLQHLQSPYNPLFHTYLSHFTSFNRMIVTQLDFASTLLSMFIFSTYSFKPMSTTLKHSTIFSSTQMNRQVTQHHHHHNHHNHHHDNNSSPHQHKSTTITFSSTSDIDPLSPIGSTQLFLIFELQELQRLQLLPLLYTLTRILLFQSSYTNLTMAELTSSLNQTLISLQLFAPLSNRNTNISSISTPSSLPSTSSNNNNNDLTQTPLQMIDNDMNNNSNNINNNNDQLYDKFNSSWTQNLSTIQTYVQQQYDVITIHSNQSCISMYDFQQFGTTLGDRNNVNNDTNIYYSYQSQQQRNNNNNTNQQDPIDIFNNDFNNYMQQQLIYEQEMTPTQRQHQLIQNRLLKQLYIMNYYLLLFAPILMMLEHIYQTSYDISLYKIVFGDEYYNFLTNTQQCNGNDNDLCHESSSPILLQQPPTNVNNFALFFTQSLSLIHLYTVLTTIFNQSYQQQRSNVIGETKSTNDNQDISTTIINTNQLNFTNSLAFPTRYSYNIITFSLLSLINSDLFSTFITSLSNPTIESSPSLVTLFSHDSNDDNCKQDDCFDFNTHHFCTCHHISTITATPTNSTTISSSTAISGDGDTNDNDDVNNKDDDSDDEQEPIKPQFDLSLYELRKLHQVVNTILFKTTVATSETPSSLSSQLSLPLVSSTITSYNSIINHHAMEVDPSNNLHTLSESIEQRSTHHGYVTGLLLNLFSLSMYLSPITSIPTPSSTSTTSTNAPSTIKPRAKSTIQLSTLHESQSLSTIESNVATNDELNNNDEHSEIAQTSLSTPQSPHITPPTSTIIPDSTLSPITTKTYQQHQHDKNNSTSNYPTPSLRDQFNPFYNPNIYTQRICQYISLLLTSLNSPDYNPKSNTNATSTSTSIIQFDDELILDPLGEIELLRTENAELKQQNDKLSHDIVSKSELIKALSAIPNDLTSPTPNNNNNNNIKPTSKHNQLDLSTSRTKMTSSSTDINSGSTTSLFSLTNNPHHLTTSIGSSSSTLSLIDETQNHDQQQQQQQIPYDPLIDHLQSMIYVKDDPILTAQIIEIKSKCNIKSIYNIHQPLLPPSQSIISFSEMLSSLRQTLKTQMFRNLYHYGLVALQSNLALRQEQINNQLSDSTSASESVRSRLNKVLTLNPVQNWLGHSALIPGAISYIFEHHKSIQKNIWEPEKILKILEHQRLLSKDILNKEPLSDELRTIALNNLTKVQEAQMNTLPVISACGLLSSAPISSSTQCIYDGQGCYSILISYLEDEAQRRFNIKMLEIVSDLYSTTSIDVLSNPLQQSQHNTTNNNNQPNFGQSSVVDPFSTAIFDSTTLLDSFSDPFGPNPPFTHNLHHKQQQQQNRNNSNNRQPLLQQRGLTIASSYTTTHGDVDHYGDTYRAYNDVSDITDDNNPTQDNDDNNKHKKQMNNDETKPKLILPEPIYYRLQREHLLRSTLSQQPQQIDYTKIFEQPQHFVSPLFGESSSLILTPMELLHLTTEQNPDPYKELKDIQQLLLTNPIIATTILSQLPSELRQSLIESSIFSSFTTSPLQMSLPTNFKPFSPQNLTYYFHHLFNSPQYWRGIQLSSISNSYTLLVEEYMKYIQTYNEYKKSNKKSLLPPTIKLESIFNKIPTFPTFEQYPTTPLQYYCHDTPSFILKSLHTIMRTISSSTDYYTRMVGIDLDKRSCTYYTKQCSFGKPISIAVIYTPYTSSESHIIHNPLHSLEILTQKDFELGPITTPPTHPSITRPALTSTNNLLSSTLFHCPSKVISLLRYVSQDKRQYKWKCSPLDQPDLEALQKSSNILLSQMQQIINGDVDTIDSGNNNNNTNNIDNNTNNLHELDASIVNTFITNVPPPKPLSQLERLQQLELDLKTFLKDLNEFTTPMVQYSYAITDGFESLNIPELLTTAKNKSISTTTVPSSSTTTTTTPTTTAQLNASATKSPTPPNTRPSTGSHTSLALPTPTHEVADKM